VPRVWRIYFHEIDKGDAHVGSMTDVERRFVSHRASAIAVNACWRARRRLHATFRKGRENKDFCPDKTSASL